LAEESIWYLMYNARKMKEIPEENRPYEKCLKFGVEALTDEELLAILLRSGSKEHSALELAYQVLHLSKENQGLQSIYHLSVQQLKSIHGIGAVKAIQLKCMGEISKRIAVNVAAKGISFDCPASIAKYYMEQLRHEEQEHLLCMMLDCKNHRLGEELIFKGTVNASYVSPREIFLSAMSYHAVGILLVHNHPSGDPSPSQADIQVTKKIQTAGILLDIPLIDHIIIGDCQYISFRERGLIET
jgi:DNA repair protein RadC